MKTNYSFIHRGAKTILLTLSTATLLATAPAAWADSASDLMEQGVYSEETKGDLNGAAQIYQKVIAQATEDRALAARAQYHLGVCYYKQNNFNDADTAFKSVVKNYADQKDMVALAGKYLAGAHPLQPVPWTDGEDLRMDIDLAGGMKVGVVDYRVDAGTTTNGEKIWRCSSHLTTGPVQSISHVEVEAVSFSPIRSFWRHSLLGDVYATYYPDHADLKMNGKDPVKKITFDSPIIDNEEAVQWMRRLTFTNGYSLDQPVLSSLGSSVVPIKWTVSGPEKTDVPAGSFECYKVELNINQTFWYSADANRYLVKFEGGGAIAELRAVTHHSPGEIETYTDATNGFSVVGPAGWNFAAGDLDKKATAEVSIIDPEGLASTEMTVAPAEDTNPDKKSLRDYVNDKLAKAAKMYNEFQIRTNSWQERTIAGQPGLSVITDYVEGKKNKTGYGIWSFGKTTSVYFQMITTPEDFKTLQPAMDAAVDSYKTQ